MAEPAAGAPDVPFVDAAVLVDEALWEDVLGGEVGYVLEELVDHVRDDLEHCQGVDYRVCWWIFERIGAPDP